MLDTICATLELDHVAYLGVNTLDASFHAVATYAEEWKQHYISHDLYLSDPCLRSGLRSHAPVKWGRLSHDPNYHTVFSQAHDFGITTTGVTIPIRSRFGDMGLLSATRACSAAEWDAQCKRIMVRLQEHSALIHDTIMRDGISLRPADTPSLTGREIEVLQWIAAGKSHGDVGDILTISVRTVEVHIRTARYKLGALNTPQAVARAVGLGLIYPL